MDKLSNEIVTIIAHSVRGRRGQVRDDVFNNFDCESANTLLNFMLCSRHYHEIVEPALYEEFNEAPRGLPRKHRPKNRLLIALFRRLVTTPKLGSNVKRLGVIVKLFDFDELDYDNHEERESPLDVSSITEQEWQRIDQLIRTLTDDDESDLSSLWAVKKGCWEAMLVLTLSLLPNLVDLKMSSLRSSRLVLLEKYLSISARGGRRVWGQLGEISSLTSLQNVTLVYHYTEDGMGPQVMMHWLGLPSLRSISAYSITTAAEDDEDLVFDQNATLPTWAVEQKFPHVTHLSLQNSCIDGNDMAYLLQSLPCLQELEYEYAGGIVGFAGFRPARLIRGICTAKSSLQRLTLLDRECSSQDHIFEKVNGGSLADLTNLIFLSTQVEVLFGRLDRSNAHLIMNLPPNLRHLKLEEIDGNSKIISPAIFHLLSNVSAFPALKELDLGWRMIDYPDEPSPRLPEQVPGFERDKACEILEMCHQAGIHMITKRSGPPLRILHGLWDKRRQELASYLAPSHKTHYVAYPYSPNWEDLCAEFGCDPATGAQQNGSSRDFKEITLLYPPSPS